MAPINFGIFNTTIALVLVLDNYMPVYQIKSELMLYNLKKSIPVLLIFACITSVSFAQKLTVYDQLVAVNNEWRNQPDVDPSLKNKTAFSLNEQELVRLHLKETEKLLRARNTTGLSAIQKKNRETNLNKLHSYWQTGVFPINKLYDQRQPIFIDELNTFCAVGYLMQQSGAENVAKEIQQTQNYSYLADIDHAKLMEWVNNSGLDFGELALIQPGYGGEWPCTITEMHYNNAGADINEYIEIHESNGGLVGMAPLDKIEFYDHNDVLYKTLLRAEMQSFFIAGNGAYLYYLFPSNEDFADSGKILLYGQSFVPLLSDFTYNASGVTMNDYYNMGQPITKHFPVTEDQNTVAGNSLVFCGTYPGTWDLNVRFATIGTLDPCTLSPAPVSLSYFNYSTNGKMVDLNWQTVSEYNNKYFAVEKSEDGIHFKTIGNIPGAINSNTIINYSFTDDHPSYINHYRLKQVDVDGHFEYSKVLFVKIAADASFTLARNIVQDNLDIQITSAQTISGSMVIYDFSGRQVLKTKATNAEQHINISNLECGKYVIRLYTTDGKVSSQQFIKGS
jgi:hypothetical protein